MNEAIQEAIKPENNPYKGQVTVSNIIDAHDPEWKKANPVKAAQIYATRTAEEGSNDDRAWEAYADQKLEESIDTNVRPLAEAQTAKSFANGVRFQKTPQDKASFILNSLDRRSYISRDTEFTILVEELQKIADAPKEENQKPDRIPLDIYNTLKAWQEDLSSDDTPAIANLGGEVAEILSSLIEHDMIVYTERDSAKTAAERLEENTKKLAGATAQPSH